MVDDAAPPGDVDDVGVDSVMAFVVVAMAAAAAAVDIIRFRLLLLPAAV